MSPRTIVGLVVLLIGSLVIGWYAGSWGFSLFEKTVPAGAVTQLVRSGTRGAYVSGGILLGLVIFAWTALVAWLSPLFRSGTAKVASTPPTP
jgi:hypothetical protein